MKRMYDAAPPRPKSTNVKRKPVGFPTSPIMPDLNAIDGVEPYNPNLAGKEWVMPVIEGESAVYPFEPWASLTRGVIPENLFAEWFRGLGNH